MVRRLDSQPGAEQNRARQLAVAPESLSRLHVTPTRAGEGHAVTQIAKTEQDSVKRWSELPEVVSVNPIHQLKPGATELLRGVDESRRSRDGRSVWS